MKIECPDLLAQDLDAVIRSWEGTLIAPQLKAGRIVAIQQLVYTWALLADVNLFGYEDRWCYHSLEQAEAALAAWSGEYGTEPGGWHRHPDSGRRRDIDGTIYVRA